MPRHIALYSYTTSLKILTMMLVSPLSESWRMVPRCGVHVVMVWNESKEPPHGVKPEQIIQGAESLYKINGDELETGGFGIKTMAFQSRFTFRSTA